MADETVVLITGASSGSGRATAILLARNGFRVFGTSRRPDQPPPATGVEMLELDVRSDESVHACVAAAIARAGRVDALVNNAGVELAGAIEEISVDEAKRQFETNLFGVHRMVRELLPSMRERRSGRIVNVSSVAGMAAVPFLGMYSASKFALEGYSEALFHELRPLNVSVSQIEVAFMNTPMQANRIHAAGPIPEVRAVAGGRVGGDGTGGGRRARRRACGRGRAGDSDEPKATAAVCSGPAGAEDRPPAPHPAREPVRPRHPIHVSPRRRAQSSVTPTPSLDFQVPGSRLRVPSYNRRDPGGLMRTTVAAIAFAAACITTTPMLQAQGEPPAVNPLSGNPDAIQTGMGLFRSRCADCHGMDARGVRGPDLTQVWASGRTDGGLFRTVRRGIPGTEMPSAGVRTTDDEVWKVLAYLKTLAAPAPSATVAGDVQSGERVFRAQCAGCHRVNGVGGRLGPDLSRIGVSRARAAVVRRIRGATEDFLDGYEPVTVTLKNGQTVRGVRKNGDLFSVQIMDGRERIQGYLRADVRDVTPGRQSAMPVFGPERLNEADLNDSLVYLANFKGFDPSVQ